MIDLRSDTVTKPTPGMLAAMTAAEVGDDVFGEDPTINELERRTSAMFGHEAGLFVPSGTMANQIAMCLLSRPGTNVVVGWRSHVVNHEEGASARNALIQFVTVDDTNGKLALDDVRWAIEAAQHHHVEVSAISVENTHMVSGGTPVSLDLLRSIAALRLPVHMDGARLFNATVASGIAPAIYAATATTVMVSLSKGLAAPVGSVLVMPAGLADRARVERKRLGGAMRQAGILAAAGLVALDTMVERLAEDHERAARLRAAVQERWPGCIGDPEGGGTNIVCFEHSDPSLLLHHLQQNGVRAGTVAPGTVRLVTHCDVDDAGIDRAVAALQSAAT